MAGSLFPNWVGTDLVRNVRFDGERMTLTTDPLPVADGLTYIGTLVWERLA